MPDDTYAIDPAGSYDLGQLDDEARAVLAAKFPAAR